MTSKARFYGALVTSVIVLVAYTMVLWVWLTRPPVVNEQSREIVSILVGNIGTLAGLVVGFWVGSSASSAQKDAHPQPPPTSS